LAGCEWVETKYESERRTADNPGAASAGKIAMSFVGLAHREGAFHGPVRERTRYLAGLNDDGSSFLVIADIIESNPPGLFLTDEELAAKAQP
jgi:hypothetical protein